MSEKVHARLKLWENEALSFLKLGVSFYQVHQKGSPKDVKLDKNAKDPILKARSEIQRTSQLLYCNPTYIEQSGFEMEQLLATPDIVPLREMVGCMTSKMTQTLWSNLVQDRPWNGITNWKRPDQQQSIVEFATIPFFTGEAQFMLSIYHDITHHIQDRNELQKRHNWLIEACHDSSPLVAMIKQTNLSSTASPDWMEKTCDRVLQTLAYATSFTDLASGWLPLNNDWISIHQICQDLDKLFSPQIQEKNLVLEFDFPQEPVKLWVDPIAFSRMLQNLVGSAIEFTSKGQIKLTCKLLGEKPPAKGLEWTVNMTGTGWFAGIKNPDAQESHSLATVQKLAQMMEGSIKIVDSPKGMTIHLPKTTYIFHH